jgi:hypothetical protein
MIPEIVLMQNRFQKILVLSSGASWRQRGMNVAAQYNGLDIVIPRQRPLGDGFVSRLMGDTIEHESTHGSVLA